MDYRPIIESAYNRKNWQELLHDIFGRRITFFATPTRIDDVNNNTAKHALYLGKIDLADGKTIAVYEVPLAESVVIERNKVNIRNLLVKHWRNSGFAGAFMFCFKENESVLRFSYVSEIMAFKEDGKLGTEATDTKRFTYYLGEGHRSRTAIDQFAKLKGSGQTLEDITKAFSIEAVSDAFFAGYKNIYEDIVEYMTGKRMSKVDGKWKEVDVHAPNAEILKEFAMFENPLKAMRDYVKKLMGRLVFLQFLQKKGWLGVPVSKEWGAGDREFMLNLYKASKHQNDFIESVLEPLFNDINTKRDGDLASSVNVGKDIKIPFLNGGLFERDKEDEATIKLPAKYFDSLFDFFSQYNFTIDENDPYDTEVGVDPEMLGRIFENLLEDNKDKGAFYTPKEIVRYMCAESLIAYLQTDMEDDKEKESVRNFVTSHDVAYLSQTLKPVVRKKIMDVKICDPAIGSGAFPIGLLNELFACLESIDGEQANRAELKKHIIQNSIYGVDIEKGAVDIARLRFWLSLVVDEDTPTALPNLDFKIMQGNSLLEQYCGVDLSNIMMSDDAFVQADAAELPEKLKQYYLPNSHEEKMKLHDEITEIVKNCIQSGGRNLPDIQVDGNDKFFLWHTWFSDVFNRPSGCNGFDIVIGNPPYVEARNSIFSEDLKNNLQKQIEKNYTKEERKCFPRGADLLIFFFETSFRLLNNKGINTFITENSWLSTDYGKSFQNYLLSNINVLGIVDSDYKYFDTADINTVISFFKKKGYGEKTPVQFFHTHENFEIHSCRITDSHLNDDTVECKFFATNNVLLQKYKWGFLFSTNEKLIRLVEKMEAMQDIGFAKKISIGQGLNITKDNILNRRSPDAVPYFISENGSIYSWHTTNFYVDKKNASNSRKTPLLILPRGLGTHFCCMNELGGYSSSYVEIYDDESLTEKEKLQLWAFCNSSVLWVLREYTGRCNLGGGMLKAEATDLKYLPLCFDFGEFNELQEIYSKAKTQKVPSKIEDAINSDIHQHIDRVVFDFFGLPANENFVIDMLIDRVNWRSKKSKTN